MSLTKKYMMEHQIKNLTGADLLHLIGAIQGDGGIHDIKNNCKKSTRVYIISGEEQKDFLYSILETVKQFPHSDRWVGRIIKHPKKNMYTLMDYSICSFLRWFGMYDTKTKQTISQDLREESLTSRLGWLGGFMGSDGCISLAKNGKSRYFSKRFYLSQSDKDYNKYLRKAHCVEFAAEILSEIGVKTSVNYYLPNSKRNSWLITMKVLSTGNSHSFRILQRKVKTRNKKKDDALVELAKYERELEKKWRRNCRVKEKNERKKNELREFRKKVAEDRLMEYEKNKTNKI